VVCAVALKRAVALVLAPLTLHVVVLPAHGREGSWGCAVALRRTVAGPRSAHCDGGVAHPRARRGQVLNIIAG
jgi:hypothetical protein